MYRYHRAILATFLRSALPVVVAVVVAALFLILGPCGCAGDVPNLAEVAADDAPDSPTDDVASSADAPADPGDDARDASPRDTRDPVVPVPEAGPGPDASPPPADVARDSAPADSGCRRACLIAGSSGADLPLGSPACTWDGECCSGSCYVVHPGTGERGTCVAPGGAALWCGGAQEWCPEAVTAGVARCAS